MHQALSKAPEFTAHLLCSSAKGVWIKNNVLNQRCSAREHRKQLRLPVKGICWAPTGKKKAYPTRAPWHCISTGSCSCFHFVTCWCKQHSPNMRSLASPESSGSMPVWFSPVPCFWKGESEGLFMCLLPFSPPLLLYPPFLHLLFLFLSSWCFPPSWPPSLCPGRPVWPEGPQRYKGGTGSFCHNLLSSLWNAWKSWNSGMHPQFV